MSTKTQQRLAATYEPNEQMEHLLALRRDDPGRFDQICDPQTRMSLGYYEQAKAAAAAGGGQQ